MRKNLSQLQDDMRERSKKRVSKPAGLPAGNFIMEVPQNAKRFYTWCLGHIQKEFEYEGDIVGAVFEAERRLGEYSSDQAGRDGMAASKLDVDADLFDAEASGLIAWVRPGKYGDVLLVIGCGKAESDMDRLPYDFARAVEQTLNRTARPELQLLLKDIRAQFGCEGGQERIGSANLAARLASMEDRPWCWLNKGGPITPSKMARMLSPFGIRPRTTRFEDGSRAKGYHREQFEDARNGQH